MPRRTAYTKKTVKKSKKTENYYWKKSSSENLSVSFSKIFIPTLLILFSFMFLTGVFAYKSVTRPFASASSVSSNDTLNKEINAVLLISAKDIEKEDFTIDKVDILIYDKKDSKITDISLDVAQQIDVKGKYGFEPLSKILSLGMSVNNDDLSKSITLLENSIENSIPYSIDNYILVDDSSYDNIYAILSSGKILSAAQLSKSLLANRNSTVFKTNMSVTELNSYREFASSLSGTQILREEKLVVTDQKMGKLLNDITFDSPVAIERKSIAILNGTNTPGLASFGSLFVKNIGGRVIATENTRTAYEKSILIADDLDTESVRALVEFFNIEVVLLKSEATNIVENEVSRSDITIILGFDLSNSL